MQIFYGTTMLVVLVLCVALITTARRILRASPLQSGELGLPRFEGFANSSKELPLLRWQPQTAEDDSAIDSAPPMSTASFIEELKAAEQSATESFEEIDAAEDGYGLGSAAFGESSTMRHSAPVGSDAETSMPRSGDILAARRSATPAYTYFLEVLLIGVSMAVLVRTQRSTHRDRLSRSSHGRVA